MISIVVPAFNEKKGIIKTLKSIKSVFKNTHHEIIVVDDGSQDSTAQLARSQKVTVICHEANKGYGAALKTGIRAASFPLIGIIDADGTYRPQDLLRLTRLADQYDMVVGARKRKAMGFSRRFAKWFLLRFARYLVGQKIPDLNSGLRVFKKNLAVKYFPLLPSGFSFTTTITLAFLSRGYSVKYSPIAYGKRIGRSKIKPLKEVINFIFLISRTIMYFNPLKVLLTISLLFFFLATAVFLYSYLFTPQVMDISVIILVTTGVQIAVLGLLADLIVKRTLK